MQPSRDLTNFECLSRDPGIALSSNLTRDLPLSHRDNHVTPLTILVMFTHSLLHEIMSVKSNIVTCTIKINSHLFSQHSDVEFWTNFLFDAKTVFRVCVSRILPKIQGNLP